ncbi:phosphonate C-P lyase system protein PhnG [Alginatibacterium sediminis]|uniref:Phosphonate C-P lyase system protein PhnG n=1 Tax=Alginatibacterium sediminis TaxID=2164068 RepID=A0A420EL24_9ALTE|nr:phosphonate C-P lyase system protein PhnG [Alginatibacterium sediminis]RKF21431.1 phosphonate C-P lyase system protein PhnG [Alginatibacterium sediminis]
MTSNQNNAERQRWLRVIALAQPSQLFEFWDSLELNPIAEVIRQPEIGLAQVKAATGGSGDAYKLADVTITRSSVRLDSGHVGVCYIKGRSKKHALVGAILDALMQNRDFSAQVEKLVISPLEKIFAQEVAQIRSDNKKTQVDFFTLIRGEDE